MNGENDYFLAQLSLQLHVFYTYELLISLFLVIYAGSSDIGLSSFPRMLFPCFMSSSSYLDEKEVPRNMHDCFRCGRWSPAGSIVMVQSFAHEFLIIKVARVQHKN